MTKLITKKRDQFLYIKNGDRRDEITESLSQGPLAYTAESQAIHPAIHPAIQQSYILEKG